MRRKYNTRYWFIKKIYSNHLLLFKTNKNKLEYKSYGNDKRLLYYIRGYTININKVINELESSNIYKL